VAPELQQQGIFVLFIFLAVLVDRGWLWLKRRTARSWPLAQGRVHKVDWRQPRTGTNRYFLADLAYYYFVDGHFYAGYLRRSFTGASAAVRWVEQMRNATVQVRYDVREPGRSLLLEEDIASTAAVAEPVVSR